MAKLVEKAVNIVGLSDSEIWTQIDEVLGSKQGYIEKSLIYFVESMKNELITEGNRRLSSLLPSCPDSASRLLSFDCSGFLTCSLCNSQIVTQIVKRHANLRLSYAEIESLRTGYGKQAGETLDLQWTKGICTKGDKVTRERLWGELAMTYEEYIDGFNGCDRPAQKRTQRRQRHIGTGHLKRIGEHMTTGKLAKAGQWAGKTLIFAQSTVTASREKRVSPFPFSSICSNA